MSLLRMPNHWGWNGYNLNNPNDQNDKQPSLDTKVRVDQRPVAQKKQIRSKPTIFSPPPTISKQISQKPIIEDSNKEEGQKEKFQKSVNGKKQSPESSEGFGELLDNVNVNPKLQKLINLLQQKGISIEKPYLRETTNKDINTSNKEVSHDEESSIETDKNSSFHVNMPPNDSLDKNIIDLPSKKSKVNKRKKQSKRRTKIDREKSPLIVKVPVLLSRTNVQFYILESHKVSFPVTNMSDIEWGMRALNVHIPSSSETILFQGELLAKTNCVNNKTNSFHSIKVPISWSKLKKISWLNSPVRPVSECKEYDFVINDEISTHYEFVQDYADEIIPVLKSCHIHWHNSVKCKNEVTELQIEGTANISVDLVQSQYIDLSNRK